MGVAFEMKEKLLKSKRKFNYQNTFNEIVLTVSGRMNVNGFAVEGNSYGRSNHTTRILFATMERD